MKPNSEIHHVRYDGTALHFYAIDDIISNKVYNRYINRISIYLDTPRRMRDINLEFNSVLSKSIDEPII